MQKYFLICQCVILLASFEGIVCPLFDFVVENFGVADIYDEVVVKVVTGRFILKKGEYHRTTKKLTVVSGPKGFFGNGWRQRIVLFSNIKPQTVHQEENNPTVVSFFVRGAFHVNHNLRFEEEWQAKYYASSNAKSLPQEFNIAWARIYTNWRPVLLAYDDLENNDIGFKFLKNENYPDLDAFLDHLPYVFKRSEIEESIRTTHSKTVYLRNKTRMEDYEISFLSADNMSTFLKLFPDSSLVNDDKTDEYYFMR